jgi:hypothetical protein
MDHSTLSQLANPFVAAEAAQEPRELPAMRLRTVKNSPAEEYSARPGAVESIPDALAAMILSRKARVEVGTKGVTITEGGTKRKYWHPDSPLCNRIGDGEKRRVVAVWNSQDTSRVHLLDEQGRYLETLPEKGRVAWFDREAGATELAGHRRVVSRVYDHLQRLHEGESISAIERKRIAAEEAEMVQRATMNFSAPEPTAEDAAAAMAARRAGGSRMETAEAVATADSRMTQAQATTTHRRQSADALMERETAPPKRSREVAEAYDPFDI